MREGEGTAETLDWQSSKCQHARGEANSQGVKYSERGRAGRAGASGVRARSKETQTAATGGRCRGRGGRGGAGFSEAEFRPRCAKWESAQRGCVLGAIEGKSTQSDPSDDASRCLQRVEAWGKGNGMNSQRRALSADDGDDDADDSHFCRAAK